MPIIYKTINKINGKVYVGVHYTSKNDGYLGSGIKLLRAVNKYGSDNFERITLERCNNRNALKREVFWIKKLDALNPNSGYNLSGDGTGIYRKGIIPWNKGKTGLLKEITLEKFRIAGKSEINKLNHLGRKNGGFLKLPYSIIKKFLSDYNKGYSIDQASKLNGVNRKKGCNLLKMCSRFVLPKNRRKYIKDILKSVDFNEPLLYYVAKIIAKKTGREPSFLRRTLKKLRLTVDCKFKFGKVNTDLFSAHNFSLLLKDTGKYRYKRKSLMT
jgi:hypothetical protein